LSQGYGFREILDPILKEMRLLGHSFRDLSKSATFSKFGSILDLKYRSGIARSYILKFFLIYKRFSLKFFIFNNS
jgi:hypothetical protein